MKDRKANISSIKRLLEKKLETVHTRSKLIYFLKGKGIAPQIAEEIAAEVEKQEAKERIFSLNEALSMRLKTEEKTDRKCHVLVGPTGVGKTTTLLKLASFYQGQGVGVGLISLDVEKGGAFAQIEQYATEWQIPFLVGGDFREKVMDLSSCERILIDTSGCNYYQPQRVEEIGERLSFLEDVAIHLTLSAATKDVDLYGAIHQFSSLEISSLIFTKLDETLTAGTLINICQKVDIPISFVTYGYPLPGEIHVATPDGITHKILTDLNIPEFLPLRHLGRQEKGV